MVRSPTTKRVTVEDYHRMAEAGVFAPEDRVELFDGEVLELAPIGSRHAACVKRTSWLFSTRLGDRAIVSVQDPIQLDDYGEPQPDLALLRPTPDFYADHHPGPADIPLAVEVAETTLRYDLDRKAPRYLAAGMPEVWVVDVVRQVVHVLTPDGARVLARGESVALQAFPDVVIEVTAIVG